MIKRTLLLSVQTIIFLVFVATFIVVWVLGQLPSSDLIKGCFTTKMYEVYLCPKSNDYVRYNQISGKMIKSLLISEDSGFYDHQGFDFSEMKKSFETNLKKKKLARGGSTITQQLAKNLFLTKEKTFTRKLLEALITVKLEESLSKKEILEKYLNVVQFGQNIFGIKKASEFYFKKSPADLNWTESAFLVMMLPNPVIYSKSYYQRRLTPFARKRIGDILYKLHHYNRMSGEEYAVAGQKAAQLFGQNPDIVKPPADFDMNVDEGSVATEDEPDYTDLSEQIDSVSPSAERPAAESEEE